MATFADMATLLMAFFVLILSLPNLTCRNSSRFRVAEKRFWYSENRAGG